MIGYYNLFPRQGDAGLHFSPVKGHRVTFGLGRFADSPVKGNRVTFDTDWFADSPAKGCRATFISK